jgi:hypothetical protein
MPNAIGELTDIVAGYPHDNRCTCNRGAGGNRDIRKHRNEAPGTLNSLSLGSNEAPCVQFLAVEDAITISVRLPGIRDSALDPEDLLPVCEDPSVVEPLFPFWNRCSTRKPLVGYWKPSSWVALKRAV